MRYDNLGSSLMLDDPYELAHIIRNEFQNLWTRANMDDVNYYLNYNGEDEY